MPQHPDLRISKRLPRPGRHARVIGNHSKGQGRVVFMHGRVEHAAQGAVIEHGRKRIFSPFFQRGQHALGPVRGREKRIVQKGFEVPLQFLHEVAVRPSLHLLFVGRRNRHRLPGPAVSLARYQELRRPFGFDVTDYQCGLIGHLSLRAASIWKSNRALFQAGLSSAHRGPT